MIEKALIGGRRYWTWVIFLLVVIGIGFLFYLHQFRVGLTVTGLSRDVTWGFYIAQFTFLVGVAASAVIVVLPYYLHNTKEFGKMTILGEFLAIPAVIMCMLFIFVDMGQPFRIINVFRYPTFHSMMFWDTIALGGYLLLNVIISRITLDSERKSVPPPKWIKPVIYLSIPWAVSIHTVTAFLYSGLAARPFWLTAVMAPRFLASAFAAGPALLILLIFILRKFANYDVGKAAIQKLAVIVLYAMLLNVFFILMELFTAFYSHIPEHTAHFKYLYFGLEGKTALVPFMWISAGLAVISIILLINPKTRKHENCLLIACIALFISIWLDKGLGMVVTGFIPSVLGRVVEYTPTFPEIMISVGVYGIGALLITILYRVALSVKGEVPG
ncbi:MAG TPA: menaquinol oxidoreductase [Bacteroidetes bacterium]|nr:menaquinol oxidoreductase [Bacteroidota bacterium]